MDAGAPQFVVQGGIATLTPRVSGGAPPYQHQWTVEPPVGGGPAPDGGFQGATTIATVSVKPTTTTTYRLTVTDTAGSVKSDTVTVNVVASVPSIPTGGTTTGDLPSDAGQGQPDAGQGGGDQQPPEVEGGGGPRFALCGSGTGGTLMLTCMLLLGVMRWRGSRF